MIALASDCMLFQLATGECLPLSAEMISVELVGEAGTLHEPEFVRNAAAAVFHYFRHDLGRESVTVAEFAEAMERVLRDFGLNVQAVQESSQQDSHDKGDLRALARESGVGCELVFFPLLRDALRAQLRQEKSLIRFHGLRGCVKRLAGARRWSPRCDDLKERILDFLRGCLGAESRPENCSLLVE